MNTIYVKAAEGRKVPMEGRPRNYIAGPQAVQDSHYYRMAIRDWDLLQLSQKEWDAFAAERAKAEEAQAAAATVAQKAADKAAKSGTAE